MGVGAMSFGDVFGAGGCWTVVEVLGLSPLEDFVIALGMISSVGRAGCSALSFFSNWVIALCRSLVCFAD